MHLTGLLYGNFGHKSYALHRLLVDYLTKKWSTCIYNRLMNNLQWIYFPYEKDIWWNCWNGESRKDRSGDVRVGVSHCIQKYIEVMLDDGRLPSNHTHLFHSPYNLISSIVFTSLKHSPCYTYHTLCLWLHGAWPPLSTLVDPLLSPDIIFGQRCKPLICASSSRHSMNSNLF